jgi:hypothetical protein
MYPSIQFEGSAEIALFSKGLPPKSGYPEDLQALEMQLSPRGGLACRFSAFTIDPDFAGKTRRFFGKIKVSYDTSWAIRTDIYAAGVVNILFVFPRGGDGKQEILSAFVESSMLPTIREYFHC